MACGVRWIVTHSRAVDRARAGEEEGVVYSCSGQQEQREEVATERETQRAGRGRQATAAAEEEAMDGDRERRERLSAPCCLPPVLFSLCLLSRSSGCHGQPLPNPHGYPSLTGWLLRIADCASLTWRERVCRRARRWFGSVRHAVRRVHDAAGWSRRDLRMPPWPQRDQRSGSGGGW